MKLSQRAVGGEIGSGQELIDAIRLLVCSEGILTETAGGVTIAVTKKLIESGRIPADETIVACMTASGLKTTEGLRGHPGHMITVEHSLASLAEPAGALLWNAVL
jgi:threonine synthase